MNLLTRISANRIKGEKNNDMSQSFEVRGHESVRQRITDEGEWLLPLQFVAERKSRRGHHTPPVLTPASHGNVLILIVPPAW
jgi:hypothetical protein